MRSSSSAWLICMPVCYHVTMLLRARPRPSGLHAWKRVTLQRRQQGHMLILWQPEHVCKYLIAGERTYMELRGQQKPRWVQSIVSMSCAAVGCCCVQAGKR